MVVATAVAEPPPKVPPDTAVTLPLRVAPLPYRVPVLPIVTGIATRSVAARVRVPLVFPK